MIEREFEKIAEFAMLFTMNRKTGVKFTGYSMFETSGDTYSSNLLLPDSEILQIVSRLCPTTNFSMLQKQMETIMGNIIGTPIPYEGYFGVDMMIYNDNNTPKVNPCIEVNMRSTMGVVSWKATSAAFASGIPWKIRSFRIHENRKQQTGKMDQRTTCRRIHLSFIATRGITVLH